MAPQDLTVRCMSWKDGRLWIATCIDFSLAAQGNTYEEARQSLHLQIRAYVREAMTVDAKHADELLTRKAGLEHRLIFDFWYWLSNRPRLRRNAAALLRRLHLAVGRRMAYNDPLPLCPAA